MKLKLSEIFDNSQRLDYFGQCDKVRGMSDTHELYWQNMMEKKIKIPIKTFVSSVDFSKILDEDETPEEWINNSLKSDPTSGAYKSMWGKEPVMFFQTAGFEFIFK